MWKTSGLRGALSADAGSPGVGILVRLKTSTASIPHPAVQASRAVKQQASRAGGWEPRTLPSTFTLNNSLPDKTSLVTQWLRICLPIQGTGVRALVREDPTCRGATKPVCHNYWSPRAWSPCSATREATAMRSPRTAIKSSPRSPQLEKACAQQRRPNTAKNQSINQSINLLKKKNSLPDKEGMPVEEDGIKGVVFLPLLKKCRKPWGR